MICSIPTWLRSIGVSEQSLSKTTIADGPQELQSSLYRCGGCDTVYVATEMQQCRSCEQSVERIPVRFGAIQKG